MYFPVGWPKYLKPPPNDLEPPHFLSGSCDRMLFAVLSRKSLSIWYCRPSVQIVSYKQTDARAQEVGEFYQAEWKADSSLIAVTTSECYIVFFKVDLDVSVANHHCLYVQHEGKTRIPKRDANGILEADSIPAIKLSLFASVQLSAEITSISCIRDELVVATTDGFLQRIPWNYKLNEKLKRLTIYDIPLSADLQHSRATRLSDRDGYIAQFDFSTLLGGYSIVLSSGKAAFIFPLNYDCSDNRPRGMWARELTDAVCVSVNHRYRLLAFGCKNGEGIVYSIDEMVGALEISHRLVVSSKDYPDAGEMTGSVKCMRWTPDGTAVAICWQNGGFSLWSVFGALLVCTLGGEYCFPQAGYCMYPTPVKSMEWGIEGYQLWMVCERFYLKDEERESSYMNKRKHQTQLLQMQFVKSTLTVNPCMANHEHLFLQGEDKLYLNTGDASSRTPFHHHSAVGLCSEHTLVGSKQWQVIPIIHSYLSSNWPIRFAAIDRSGQCVAVAGKTGLAHYALFTRKWKLFGNETQERDLVVLGGLTWWKDFICLTCYNLVAQRDEIRCYPRGSKLDNTFACVTKVPAQVLLLNTFRDILIVFCIDFHIMLYRLERKHTTPNPTLLVTKMQEYSLQNFVPHPFCVTGLTLTSLRPESGVRVQKPSKEAESILLNVSGKLLMFQYEKSVPSGGHAKEDNNKYQPEVPFCSPSVVASSVENLWTTSRANLGKMQLMEALWLGCGAQGMKVWLPLFPRDEGTTHNFMSKRIMLPFKVDIYPLAVLFEDAIILGTACDAVNYSFSSLDRHLPSDLPYCTLDRTSQIYLHHILRQLLRRNLGVHALDLAHCCRELPYFAHVLELLLHEVLEAEATSKEPIPDPLLPRVVAFIQEFKEFLQTVVHCARKTEVALWPYLFSKVGNPKDLFEECLETGELKTAASYLIILQNLEKPSVSRQHATQLLNAALDGSQWDVAKDLIRFLRAIDPSDVESHAGCGVLNRMSSNPIYSPPYPSPPLTPSESSAINVTSIQLQRSTSFSESELAAKEISKNRERLKSTTSDSQGASTRKKFNSKSKDDSATEQFYIDQILNHHAHKLLITHQLRDLGLFAANMDDFHLVGWLRKERLRAAKVEDFVTAIQEVHNQFQWPFPILSLSSHQLLKKNLLAASSTSLTSELLNGLPDSDHSCMLTNTGLLPVLEPSRPLTLDALSVTFTSDEVFLKPQIYKAEDSSITTTDVLSDNSSWLAEQDSTSLDQSISGEQLITHELEMMSQEVANRGPPQSDLELRYLLQVLMEAGCMEWSLLVAVVLRDALAVIRAVNTASMTDTPLEIVARMREGLSFLELWADTECVGYRAFFHTIRSQIQVLAQVVEQAPPTKTLTISTENLAASDDDKTLSPVSQEIRAENETEVNNATDKEEKRHDCVVS